MSVQAADLNPGQGLIQEITASGALSLGDVLVDGDLHGLVMLDIASGAKGPVKYGPGTWNVAKTSGTMTKGDEVCWDDTNNIASKTMTLGKRMGIVAKDAATGDTYVAVHVGPGPKQAAVAAALTDNSGGAAADGTIGAVTTFTPSVAWNGSSVFPSAADATAIATAITALMAAVKELSTKQNEVVAGLKTAGLMANA